MYLSELASFAQQQRTNRMRNMKTFLTYAVITGLVSTTTSAQVVPGQTDDQATVWYLRHAGWAVRLGDVLLVFDYQESLGMEDVNDGTPRNLASGFIDAAEIEDLDVYVFVTHAHGDHYDPVIFEWQGAIEKLSYIIGWDEQPQSHCERFTGADASCHIMGGLRATADLGGIQVYTIDSDHNDIPEVAYLVRHGDWIVYHNGDYMADYVADYAYLKTISDRIDFAFVAGYPDRRWPHLARAVHLAREFDVPVLFPIHFRDREMCESFVAEVAAEGVSAEVECPTARGQRFVVAKGDRGVSSRIPLSYSNLSATNGSVFDARRAGR
jgi:L-ascorbate metabolism protein UlaG (beta-lactamase superfamily)